MRDLIPELPMFVEQAPRWWIALSGGADSVALLYGLEEKRRLENGPPLRAIHINHGLHKNADDWAKLCQRHCSKLGVDLSVIRCCFDLSGKGLEAASREKRYLAFADCLDTRDVLFTAHHRDDLVETVFLRLLRGAGLPGLSAIPRTRALGLGIIYRPFLECDRRVINERVISAGLDYVIDPSNDDTAHDRNYLRHIILPHIAERWPGYRQTVSRAAKLQQQAQIRIKRSAPDRFTTILGEPSIKVDASLNVEDLAGEIHQWLTDGRRTIPDYRRLMEFARQCHDAACDRLPELSWENNVLRVWRGNIIMAFDNQLWRDFPKNISVGKTLEGSWGKVAWMEGKRSESIAEGLMLSVTWSRELAVINLPGRPQKKVRRFLQEAGVPPWWRATLPVLSQNAKPIWLLPITKIGETMPTPEQASSSFLTPIWTPPTID